MRATAAAGMLVLAVPAPARAEAFIARLNVGDLGTDSSLRIRVYYEPGFVAAPPHTGHLFLVAADSARGNEVFFIPSDLAFEVGERQVYRVEFEQASDLLGQALGGRLRPGEPQIGLVMAPSALRVGEYFPAHPESIQVRYAHHRAAFRPADAAERAAWHEAVDPRWVMQGLNAWWDWFQMIEKAPPLSEGEARFFAERLFPGQGHVVLGEDVDPTGLRNAILRVGERKLLNTPVVQRVAPAYPMAVRQAGIEGLVVVLGYVSPRGVVEDATVLSSNTVHLLNLASLRAALDWRFKIMRNEAGDPVDGWRLIPFQFRLQPRDDPSARSLSGLEPGTRPPRVLVSPPPEYPDKARRSRVEGTVVYRARIDSTGKMVQSLLLEPVHPLLDAAALTALEHTLFEPAFEDGVPVEAEVDVSFTFPPAKP
jgi:TonB family protein